MSWKFISKKPLLKTPYTHMESWLLRRDNEEEHEYDMTISSEVIIVFALQDNGDVVLLKQFFVRSQGYHHTLVAGAVDDGELPEEAARRELKEEAGIIATEMHYLGSVSRAKKDTMIMHSFIATGFDDIGEQELQDDEDIVVSSVSVDEFKALLRNGEIEDAPVAHTAYWALDYLKLL